MEDKYVVSRDIVIFVDNGKIVLDNYANREQRALKYKYINLLFNFIEPNTVERAIELNSDLSSDEAMIVVGQLIEDGILINDVQKIDKYSIESLVPAARYFYNFMRNDGDTRYEGNVDSMLSMAHRVEEFPSNHKSYKKSKKIINLTTDDTVDFDFYQRLLNRSSIRNTNDVPITKNELSNILYYSLGATGRTILDSLGSVPFRTAPTPGGRASIEAYIVTQNSDIDQGLYHYNYFENKLELMKFGDFQEIIDKISGNQLHIKSSSVYILFTARMDSLIWKYPSPESLISPYVELGSIVQSQYLIAHKLGIGSVIVGSARHKTAEKLLEINPNKEAYLAMMSMGHVAEENRFDRRDIDILKEEYFNEQ